MSETKGMTLYVLRNARWEAKGTDCSNNGITSQHETLNLVGTVKREDDWTESVVPLPKHMQVFPARADAPAVVLHPGNLPGAPFLAPAFYSEFEQVWKVRKGMRMAGGNYAATSDSRVSELVEQMIGHRFYGALSVHDRFES